MLAELGERASEMDAEERWSRLHELESQARRVEAEMATLLASARRERDGRVDGHRSLRARLRAEFRWADADVTERLRLARLADDVPEVIEALHDGRIGVSQARAFGKARANPRCGTELREFVALLLDQARTLSFKDFSTCIRRWEQLADADGSHRTAEATHASRRLHAGRRSGARTLVERRHGPHHVRGRPRHPRPRTRA